MKKILTTMLILFLTMGTQGRVKKQIAVSAERKMAGYVMVSHKDDYQASPAWKDSGVNKINRIPPHADFVNKNEEHLSLHGTWDFACEEFPNIKKMPIPSMWELNSVSEPMYCGVSYEDVNVVRTIRKDGTVETIIILYKK